MNDKERIEELEDVLRDLISNDIDCLCYPDVDVYGYCLEEDIAAPFWSECGLYGRVGKEAARTLLARHKRACRVLGIDD